MDLLAFLKYTRHIPASGVALGVSYVGNMLPQQPCGSSTYFACLFQIHLLGKAWPDTLSKMASLFTNTSSLWQEEDAHILIPETCKYVTSHGKGLCRCDQLKDAQMGTFSWTMCVGPV